MDKSQSSICVVGTVNELVEETATEITDELEEMMLEQALDISLGYMDIDAYDHLYTLFAERFDKSKPELKTIIAKVLIDTLRQLQKDSVWTSTSQLVT